MKLRPSFDVLVTRRRESLGTNGRTSGAGTGAVNRTISETRGFRRRVLVATVVTIGVSATMARIATDGEKQKRT